MNNFKLPLFKVVSEAIFSSIRNYKSLIKIGFPSFIFSSVFITVVIIFFEERKIQFFEHELANIQTKFEIGYYGIGAILMLALLLMYSMAMFWSSKNPHFL